MRGDVHHILSPEPLNTYSPVVQWFTLILMLILKFIIGLQSQSIRFTNESYWAHIPREGKVLIEDTRDFKINGKKCDIVLRLNKITYGQDEAA